MVRVEVASKRVQHWSEAAGWRAAVAAVNAGRSAAPASTSASKRTPDLYRTSMQGLPVIAAPATRTALAGLNHQSKKKVTRQCIHRRTTTTEKQNEKVEKKRRESEEQRSPLYFQLPSSHGLARVYTRREGLPSSGYTATPSLRGEVRVQCREVRAAWQHCSRLGAAARLGRGWTGDIYSGKVRVLRSLTVG